jgi:hypothetical protein
MATKKKNKKKATSSKKTASRKLKLVRQRTTPKKSEKKKAAPKPTAKKKAAVQTKGLKQAGSGKTASAVSKQALKKRPSRSATLFSQDASEALSLSLSGSGDLQGLSRVESSDSESVDELLEEGNAFEAGVVAGVEDAGDRGEREVRTREVPEDDVPEEYLDKD